MKFHNLYNISKKIKAQLLGLLVVGLRVYKNSDITMKNSGS